MLAPAGAAVVMFVAVLLPLADVLVVMFAGVAVPF
jgi:hypothetical protein